MSVKQAPIQDGETTPPWAVWYQSVSTTLKHTGVSYPVAELPGTAQVGTQTFAANGRKSGETAGNGTGVPVWWDGAHWRTHYDNSVVSA